MCAPTAKAGHIELLLAGLPDVRAEPGADGLGPLAEAQAANNCLLGRHADRLGDLLAQVLQARQVGMLQAGVRFGPARLIEQRVVVLVQAADEGEEAVVVTAAGAITLRVFFTGLDEKEIPLNVAAGQTVVSSERWQMADSTDVARQKPVTASVIDAPCANCRRSKP